MTEHHIDLSLLGSFFSAGLSQETQVIFGKTINLEEHFKQAYTAQHNLDRYRGLKGMIGTPDDYHQSKLPKTGKVGPIGIAFDIAYASLDYNPEKVFPIPPEDIESLLNLNVHNEGVDIAFMSEEMAKKHPLTVGTFYQTYIGYMNENEPTPIPMIVSVPHVIT